MTSTPLHVKTSIILPVHNADSTIAECLDSICQQSLPDFELLVIDDGSTDQSITIIRDYQQSDHRIRLIEAGRVGLVKALNLGIEHTSGEYIARMDADDRMYSTRLEKQQQYLDSHPDTGLISCKARLFPETEIKRGYQEYMLWQNQCLTSEEIARQIFIESPFAHPSVMIRRSALNKVGGYRQGNFPEDYELWLRLHSLGIKMAKLNETLLDWRESPNRTSRIDPRYRQQAFDQLRATYLVNNDVIPKNRPLVFWGAGRKTRKRIQLLLDNGYDVSAWVDIDKNKIGKTIQGAPVHDHYWLEQEPKPFVLSYVNNHGARKLIIDALEKMGYQSETDYLIVG